MTKRGEKRHGTYSCYVYGRCRCAACTTTNRETVARTKRNRLKRLEGMRDVLPHGRISTYNNWGCRCDPCRRAKAKSNADYGQRRKRAGS